MYPTRILITLISLILIAVLFVTGIIVSHNVTVESTPLIVSVLGFIALCIQNLVTGAKIADKVEQTSAQLDNVLNGGLDEMVARAVRRQLHIYFTGDEPPKRLDKH